MPTWYPTKAAPLRLIRLERGATAVPLSTYRWPFPPLRQSWLSVADLENLKPLPDSERGLYLTEAERKRIPLLWRIPNSDFVWGDRSTFPRGPLGGMISPRGDHGQIYLTVYDATTHQQVLAIDASFRHFDIGGLVRLAAWMDSRYLILPATLRQEIIYVCDMQSKRQDEPPPSPAKGTARTNK